MKKNLTTEQLIKKLEKAERKFGYDKGRADKIKALKLLQTDPS